MGLRVAVLLEVCTYGAKTLWGLKRRLTAAYKNTVQEFPMPKAKMKNRTANQGNPSKQETNRKYMTGTVWKEVQGSNKAFVHM